MEISKTIVGIMCLFLLLVGGLAGYVMAPEPTTTVVEVPKLVEVPGPEKIVEVEVTKIVQVSNTSELNQLRLENIALESSYDKLVERYEEVKNERFDPDEFELEGEYLDRAKELLTGEYKYLFLVDDYKLSEITFSKWLDEDASIRTVTRYVDGKRIDYAKPSVDLRVKVIFDDGDSKQTEYFDVEIDWDLDSDGDEEETVNVELE